jgi:aryl sulfotransferase
LVLSAKEAANVDTHSETPDHKFWPRKPSFLPIIDQAYRGNKVTKRPERTRVYRSGLLDSTYWDRFLPRDNDIVISTSFKAGTTWTQRICAALVFQTAELEVPVDASSPWLDFRLAPQDFVIPALEAQTHRRFIKSHLPLDAIPFYDQVKYIVVGRDARDVFMSLMPHHFNIVPVQFDLINARDGAEAIAVRRKNGMEVTPAEEQALLKLKRWEGEDFPTLEGVDIHEFWWLFMTKSMFPWETDGYPYWSHFYHLKSWWDFRGLSNILFVHYADLLQDLDGQMRRISKWLDIDIDENVWPSLVEAATFETMKSQFEKTTPAITHKIWRDPKNFFHKGSNGRWRDVLTEDDLALHEQAKRRTLSPAAIEWLEDGSLKAGYPSTV